MTVNNVNSINATTLQYPLPGLSHCDLLLQLSNRRRYLTCSTLYRAYPIATGRPRWTYTDVAILQYPLPGLSHCDYEEKHEHYHR